MSRKQSSQKTKKNVGVKTNMPSKKVKKSNDYNLKKIEEIKGWVFNCDTIGAAYSVLQEKLNITRDHARKLNKKYGFWMPYGHSKSSFSESGKPMVKIKDLPPTKESVRIKEVDGVYKVVDKDGNIKPLEFSPSWGKVNYSDNPSSNISNVKTWYNGDTNISASLESTTPSNINDVIKECGIDTNKWGVKSFSVSGPNKKGTYNWRASFEKNSVNFDSETIFKDFVEKTQNHAPKVFKYNKIDGKKDCLYVLNIHDLHLAKLACSAETGHQNYDIRIAERLFNEAVEDLLNKVSQDRIEEVIVIVGSDGIQFNDTLSRTEKGTYVDSDTRLPKAFDVYANMIVTNVEKIASSYKVRVVSIPGNHDTTVSLFLGNYIHAYFRNNLNVFVDKSPNSRKYYGYGKTLICFDHGSDAKGSTLPLVMMRENQDTISNYKYLEILTGHFHRDSVSEYSGVKVRIAPALCPPDAWHAKSGFVGNIQTAQGLLYQKENGLEAIYYSKPVN